MKLLTLKSLLALCLLAVLSLPAYGQGDAPTDVDKLKAKLAEQQQQIDALLKSQAEMKKMIEDMSKPSTTTTASNDAATPASPAPAAATASPASTTTPLYPRLGGDLASMNPVLNPPPPRAPRFSPQTDTPPAPLQLQLGNITITPIGFLDAAGVWRNKNAGSGIGSNFGSIPFDNAVPGGKLGEVRFSPQNSRVGFRIDGNWKGLKFINYLETDFLGTGAANNIGITNGAFVPRMRLFWVSMRKGSWEVLGGQSWSMFSANRKGISALPGDIFYSQVFDVNYLIGMPWTRQESFRVLYHGGGDKVTFGLSAEAPNQYAGGYGGGGTITLPSALGGILGTQLDNGSASFLSTPNVAPDIIAKLAFDPHSRVHFEIGGIQRTFKVFNTSTGQANSGKTFSKSGAGGEVNGNFEVAKGLRLISNTQYGEGIGRYFFGNAPDVVVRADGSLSPIHTFTTTDGFEATVAKNTLLYFYFGGINIGKNVALDTNGSPVGWGYTGASNGQNRSVNEYTFGLNQTVWKSPAYGAINIMVQYEYATRTPWYVAAGALDHAADHTIYWDLRYTLPGSAPPSK